MKCCCTLMSYPATANPDTCPLHGAEGHTYYIWGNGQPRVIYARGHWLPESEQYDPFSKPRHHDQGRA